MICLTKLQSISRVGLTIFSGYFHPFYLKNNFCPLRSSYLEKCKKGNSNDIWLKVLSEMNTIIIKKRKFIKNKNCSHSAHLRSFKNKTVNNIKQPIKIGYKIKNFLILQGLSWFLFPYYLTEMLTSASWTEHNTLTCRSWTINTVRWDTSIW